MTRSHHTGLFESVCKHILSNTIGDMHDAFFKIRSTRNYIFSLEHEPNRKRNRPYVLYLLIDQIDAVNYFSACNVIMFGIVDLAVDHSLFGWGGHVSERREVEECFMLFVHSLLPLHDPALIWMSSTNQKIRPKPTKWFNKTHFHFIKWVPPK